MDMKILTVTFNFTEPVLGTVPKNKEVYGKYIASKAPVPENGMAEIESVEDLEESGWTGFHLQDDWPFVYDYYVKGHLKDVGNVLKDQLGVQNLRSKIENYVFVRPRRIFFRGQDGGALVEGILERPLRAQTAQGPRVTVVRSDTLENASLTCEIVVLKNKEVTTDLVTKLFDYGSLRGMGQWRNGGYGRYVAEVVNLAVTTS